MTRAQGAIMAKAALQLLGVLAQPHRAAPLVAAPTTTWSPACAAGAAERRSSGRPH